jgi:hypothetical protein
MNKIKIIIYRCGVIGSKIAMALLDKKGYEVVGAVNIDPELVAKDLGGVMEKMPMRFFLKATPKLWYLQQVLI